MSQLLLTQEDIGTLVMTSEGIGRIERFREQPYVAFPVIVRIGSVNIEFSRGGKDLNCDFEILHRLPKEDYPEYYL